MAAPSPTASPVPEEEEFYSSWSLFLVCMLLITSLLTSYYLQIRKIRAVHETLVSIFAGMFVGLIIRLARARDIQDMLTFKHTLFFNLLLPPIILNSGYELKQENFFRNFGSILTFAFLGTFISAVGIGLLVYIYSFLGLESMQIGFLECLTFGSTLSATDPVTILAIFNQYKVDPKLYTVIFGESLLNDAVSIVMYETLTQFHDTDKIYVSSVFHGIGIFLLSFSVSMALGVAFGLLMSLLLKHSKLNLYPSIEGCLIPLSAYTCYFFSTGIGMSGIVSLLFCGITLKHYAYHTMSRKTQRATKSIFQTLAQLSENFIFVYLGLALFTSAPVDAPRIGTYVKPLFIVVSTIAVVSTRYIAVFPLAEAINFFHRHVRGQRGGEELPHSYQMMLFWAGLRGAVGVALAAGFQGENAQTLRTTVLVVVVLTVLVFGGTTARMLEVLGIRTGVEDDVDGGSSDEEDNNYRRWNVEEGGLALRRTSGTGPGGRYRDDEDGATFNHYHSSNGYASRPPLSPFRRTSSSSRLAQADRVFSVSSSESDSDGGEVLPEHGRPSSHIAAAPAVVAAADPTLRVDEDGKWFQALDERYLLPLFSNATASRTFHARRASRRNSPNNGAGTTQGTPAGSDDEGGGELDAVDLGSIRTSPALRQPGGGGAVGSVSGSPNLGDRSPR